MAFYLLDKFTGEVQYHSSISKKFGRQWLETSFKWDAVIPASSRPVATGPSDPIYIEFQGRLLKSSIYSGTFPERSKVERLYRKQKQFVADTFYEMAFEVSEQDHVRFENDLVGLVLSAELRNQLFLRAEVKLDPYLNPPKSSVRGAIASFSKRSRWRLLQLAARLDDGACGVFLTLTYKSNQQDYKLSKEHLDKFLRWLKYNYPDGAFLWRMEEQIRGAIHYHIFCFNVDFIPARRLRGYWRSLIHEAAAVHVVKIQSSRKAVYYISKYLAKPVRNMQKEMVSDSEPILVSEPYSEKREKDVSNEGDNPHWRGRYWGIVNRELMPYAPITRLTWRGSWQAFLDFRRLARRYTKNRLNWRSRVQGFTLFVNDIEQWLDVWYTHCQSELENLRHEAVGHDASRHYSSFALEVS